jgi:hypothetical protein
MNLLDLYVRDELYSSNLSHWIELNLSSNYSIRKGREVSQNFWEAVVNMWLNCGGV